MPTPNPATSAPDTPPQSFEAAMERLEVIVGEMENTRLPLEELIRCYEEGTRLVKVCNERLAVAEQRIEIITRDAASEAQAANHPPVAVSTPAATVKSNASDPKHATDAPVSTGRPTKKNNEVSLF